MTKPNAYRPDQVAAVVVLYNSPAPCLENIATFFRQVDKLYIIDNSPVVTAWAVAAFGSHSAVSYEHCPENVGIATALNKAARQALAEGYRFLLTMDDDSRAPAGLISQMLHYLNTADHADQIGILTPYHQLTTAPQPEVSALPTGVAVRTTMTSGNLVDLRIYQAVGPFNDALFIDLVDHEYNLRLHSAGYQIIMLPRIRLIHSLGQQKRRFGLSFVSHSPARNYYLARNNVVVGLTFARRYPGYALTAGKVVAIEIGKALLLEDKPLLRLRYLFNGLRDGFRRRLGPLPT